MLQLHNKLSFSNGLARTLTSWDCMCKHGPHADNYGELYPGWNTNPFSSLSLPLICLHFPLLGLSVTTHNDEFLADCRTETREWITSINYRFCFETFLFRPAAVRNALGCLNSTTRRGRFIGLSCPMIQSHSLHSLHMKTLIVILNK